MNENEIVIINTEFEISVEQVGAKGDNGDDGLSAYQVWLSLGNVGTEQDFINSLTGPKGDNGDDGLSAYQVWLNLGNTGTEQDFIDSLTGPKGDNGIGVVAGGTTGQVLSKKSDSDYDTEWINQTSDSSWGNIEGDIENQTDLQTILNNKVNLKSNEINVYDINPLYTNAELSIQGGDLDSYEEPSLRFKNSAFPVDLINGSDGTQTEHLFISLPKESGDLIVDAPNDSKKYVRKDKTWEESHDVINGGTTGQVLTKKSNSDYDTEWKTPSGGGTTLTAGYNVIINNNQINVGTYLSDTTNTTLGLNADNKKGTWNTVMGYNALNVSLSSNPNYENTVFGFEALKDSNGIREATAIGLQSQQSSGNDAQGNTSVGYQSLIAVNGSLNTAVGRSAGGYNNFNNSSMFGYNAQVTGSNQVQLGDSSTNTYVYGTVQSRSDERDKFEINDINNALDFLMLLKPKTYKFNYRDAYYDFENYKEEIEVLNEETQLIEKKIVIKTKKIKVENDGSRAGNRTHSGLIAQDVEKALNTLNIDLALFQDHAINGGEDVKSLGYNGFIAYLIKAVQEQQEQLNELKNEINLLKNKE